MKPLVIAFLLVAFALLGHGCKDDTDHSIDIEVSASADRVVVRVTDDCAAFDPLAASAFDPATPLEQRSAGGMGIHLYRSFARKVHYARSGDRNRLEIVL